MTAAMKGFKAAAFPKHEGRMVSFKGSGDGGSGAGAGSGADLYPSITSSSFDLQNPRQGHGLAPGPGLGQGLGTAPGQGLPRYEIRVRAHRVIVCAKETIEGTPHPLDLTPTLTITATTATPTPTPTTGTATHPVSHLSNKTTANTTSTTTAATTATNTINTSSNRDLESVTASWTGSFTDPRFRAPLTEHALTGQVRED